MNGQLHGAHRIRGYMGPEAGRFAHGLCNDTVSSSFYIAPMDVAKSIKIHTSAGN
jgi:hypothetical protein